MSRTLSPSTGRPHGVRLVLQELEIARSTFLRGSCPAQRVGCRSGQAGSADAVQRCGAGREDPPGPGRRSLRRRRTPQGVGAAPRGGCAYVEAARAAPDARGEPAGTDASHTRARPAQPGWHEHHEATGSDVGTDLTTVQTRREGQAAVFVAVDRCTVEGVGIHAAKDADRFEALEPIRQGVRERFGAYAAGVAAGLEVRHDNGSEYTSGDHHFQDELGFLGIQSSPAFVRAPEGTGCAERFIRTLKEQLLWLKVFDTVEELRLALHAWLKVYNERWLIERHGHRSPAQVRRDLLAQQAGA